MTLRQRPQTAPSATHPESSSSTRPSATGTNQVSVPWYRYPLNLILAQTLRFLGKFGFWIHDRQYKPNGIPVTRRMKVGMRDGVDIVLHIYEPTSTQNRSDHTSSSDSTPRSSSHSRPLRPCVINFHGGGFTIGSGTDDSRWARWCTNETSTTESSRTDSTPNKTGAGLEAIFISVEYRLAPEYPYPTPTNDCIDATRYILDHPEELGIDVNKVFLSGFSAGGSLAVTTALALSPSHTTTTSSSTIPTPTTSTTSSPDANKTISSNSTNKLTSNPIRGVVAFYPVLDFATPRSIKRNNAQTYANSIGGKGGEGKIVPLPGWMTKMFDTSYLPPDINRMDPMISPGLAPSLEGFPDMHLILCGSDVLANEGREFGERLSERMGSEGTGREVVMRTVAGARHGWDKPPLPLQASVHEEYDAAIESMKRWCA